MADQEPKFGGNRIKKSKWKRIKDGLPPPEIVFLAYGRKNFMVCYVLDNEIVHIWDRSPFRSATHWRPLPKPPK
jgi:hypothetical protein